MQIFSRKRSIEDQFKHQVDSYGENLASNLLSEGLRPPPWLWISRSLCPNTRELNREQLISEILDQHPRATTPAKSNIYIVQDLKKTNVNLFSNFTFPEQDALSKFCGVKNRDDRVSNDVPESSMQNSETRVEVEFTEKQFTNSSVSHNDTNNRCSKRAKTLDNLVEEHNFPEFTGRVTRSMSADKKSSCVNRNNSVRRSRSQVHNCQSLDPPSIMTESQGIANIAHDGSEVNECILDDLAAYATEDGCQLTNTLSSRLSAISLLPGPDIHFAEIIECDESPVSKFDQENIKNAEILHNSRTISRIEEYHVDSAKEQADGFVEIANPLSSVQTPRKSFEKTSASDRNADECHANSKEAISSTGITNKSESKPAVERKELYSKGNPIADSDIFCNAFNHNGDESAYTSETDVQVIGSNGNVSLPLTDHLNGTGHDSSLSIGNMLNSFKSFTVQPTLKIVKEGSDGEKYTGQVVNEAIEVHMQDKSTDPSAQKDAERSSSLSILSRNDIRSPNLNSGEKITLKEFGLVEERMTPDVEKNCKSVQPRYLLRSSTSHDNQHSASTFSVTTNSCNLKESVDKGHDNTWPKQKRYLNQFINVLHTSPRLRVKTHKHNKPVNCTGKKSSDYNSGVVFESQSTNASQNTEVELPEAVSGTQFRVKQISKKPHTLEGEQESIGKCHASDEDQEVNVGEEYFSINADRNVPKVDKCSLGKFGNNSPFKLGEYEGQHGSLTLSGITKSCHLKESVDEGHDNTWPKRKRNRSQFNNVLGTSPRMRVETHKHKKPVNSIGKKSSANISGAIFESQPAMTSQNTEVEIPEAVSGSQIRVEQISKKPRNSEGEQELRGKYRASDEDQEVNTGAEYFSVITDCNVPNLDKCSLEKVVKNNPSNLDKREESMIKSKTQGRERSSHNVDGSSMFSEHHEDVVYNLDEDLPDEGFAIDIAPIIADGIITTDAKISSLSEERASLLEQLCKSGSVLTMESCPLDDNIHKIPDVHQFSLADVLEQTNLSCDSNWSDKDQPSTSKSVRTTEKFPSTPPIETLQQRKMRKSFASGEEHVSNPDYVCFRIDENSSVSQEETTSDHVINSNEVCRSPNITALADVTSKYQNIMPNTDSVSRKYSERETFDSVKPKSRLKADSKENINLEGKLSHVTNRTGSLQRVSSAKTTNRNIVKSSSEKWSKPNNIVSNISSFLPLVKEKQQTTTHALGKRDIKVKALEAAEAAKRLEEKKQQEREMKKAAAKLERARLEQENIRQLEVKQKQKEELRKKKGADAEAKKRQIVVEKTEKERKRRCTEETRRHQRANDRNIQDKNEDVKKRKRKEASKGVKKLTKSDNGMKAACTLSRDTTSVVSKAECDDLTHVINSVNAHGAPPQVKCPIQDRMSVTAENRELSYEISPFKDSDDEEGDDDYARRKKFVPSWARKESVNLNILANRHLNPTAVFSRKRSFDILQVLAPPVNRRPLP